MTAPSSDFARPAPATPVAGCRSLLVWPREHPWIVVAFVTALAVTGSLERFMGRTFFGPDGRFGFWEGDIWSSENSQRFADPYSFSHLAHGILFFWALGLVARRQPLHFRFLLAVLLEAGWELLENSPIIINRYRAATIALGYDGDSILNSVSDILMMSAGFLFASRARLALCVAVLLAMEIGCAVVVRDNLTLNVIMLAHPIEAIKQWQMAGQPHL